MSELMTPLETLADEINELHGQIAGALRTTVDLAIKCGEKLARAKATCGHGNWLPWLKENFEGSERVARDWMQLHEHRDILAATADLGVTASLEHIRKQLKAAKEARDNEATLAEIDEAERECVSPVIEVTEAMGTTPEPTPANAAKKVAQIAQRLETAQAITGAALAQVDALHSEAQGSEAAWLRDLRDWIRTANDALVEFVDLGMTGGGQ